MEKHNININGVEYVLSYDKYTGDWCVHSESDSSVQQDYMLTKQGALNYILDSADVLQTDDYKRAPDRC